MLLDSQSDVDRIYAEGRWEALCANVALYPHIVGIETLINTHRACAMLWSLFLRGACRSW